MAKTIIDGLVYEDGQEPRLVEKRDITGQQFIQTRIDAGDFDVWRVSAVAEGDVVLVSPNRGINRSFENIRVSMVTRGSRKYESLRKRFEPITLGVGSFNTDLPNIQDDDRYLVTAMTADTEYYCVSRKDFVPYNCTRIVMDTGSVELPTGKSIFIGGGATNYGEGPMVLTKSTENRSVQVATPVFGLIFW